MSHHLSRVYILYLYDLVMSPTYGASRCMTINLRQRGVVLCSVTKCPQIFICYPDTTFDRCQSETYLSFSPTTFGQLETPQFCACLCNRSIIKTLMPKYGLVAHSAGCSLVVF
jgi:hypothetical protein